MVDGLAGGAQGGGGGVRLTGAGIAREAREGAAGHLDPDAVAGLEPVRGRPEPDDGPGDLVGAGQADQAVAHVARAAPRVHVAQPHEHVGVAQAGPEPDLRADLADDLGIPGERGRGVAEHVRAGLQGGVVHPPGPAGQPCPARRGGRVRRVVAVPVRDRLARRLGRQPGARLEMEPPRRVPGRRPGLEVPPGFLAHHEQAYRRARRRLLAAGVRQPELDGLPQRRALHRRVRPRADGQPGRPPRLLEDGEVPDLAGQEDVIPAPDRADRHAHLGDPVPVVDPGPARVIRVVGQDVLDVVRVVPQGGDIGPGQRQRVQGPAGQPAPRDAPEHRPAALLARDHDPPAERGLQGQPVLAQEFQRQRRLGHVRDHRLDLRRQAVGHRPLHVSQVARAGQHDGAAGPRLLHQPFQGGQAVLALTPHRVEHAAGPERAPGALHQHLEPALGQRPGHARGQQPPPAVGGAEQCRRRCLPRLRPWRPPVRQQDGAVGHRHPEIAGDGQIPRQRRAQPQDALHQVAVHVHRR